MKSFPAAILIAGFVTVVAIPDANAQDGPPSKTASSHRFFDATNITLTGLEAGALLADGITTQKALNE